MLSTFCMLSQLCLSVAGFLYFSRLLRSGHHGDDSIKKESRAQLEKLHALRKISLTPPLTEKTRPHSFSEIRGQSRGKTALLAALCGENPQHVILYGPPGVGKTAAARAALYEAKKNPKTPFLPDAPFVEMDATTIQYDERGIADPLIGSVHDPIYQGAGAYGPGGIPQPKPGAVTKAHGGILFLDEIGELPPLELNRLLKVLEDRKVFFESAYYSRENKDIPRHIHDMFQNGLPADFRLVGATTQSPEALPPALRSRCVEIFFDSLTEKDLMEISESAAGKSGFSAEKEALLAVLEYAASGRDAVNLVQSAGSYAALSGKGVITREDILWVAESGRYMPRPHAVSLGESRVGVVRGLAVNGAGGTVMDIEAVASFRKGKGTLTLTGAAETELLTLGPRRLSRRGTALAAAETVLAFLEGGAALPIEDYQIRICFPASSVADGPSAGLALLAGVYSAICGIPLPDTVAFTGEVTPRGAVLPVGGIPQKVAAAAEAGIRKLYMPAENAAVISSAEVEIVGVCDAHSLLSLVFGTPAPSHVHAGSGNFSASAVNYMVEKPNTLE